MYEPALNLVSGDTPARPGYDHPWYRWRPFPSRRPVSWPGGAATAVSVVVHLGASEWETTDPNRPQPVGGRGLAPPPDYPRMSHREFGHRVGIFRLLDVLSEVAVTPASVLDVATAECYPALLAHLLPATSEVIAGGLSASRPVTSDMGEEEERDYIGQTLDRLQAATGSRPQGWLGPEHSESVRTLRLLDEAGLAYVADWGNDDLPYAMDGAGDRLWAFPLWWEMSDLSAMYSRLVPPAVWSAGLSTAFDVLHAEGGRILSLHLQPWVSGQAFRASALESALRHIKDAEGVWFASPAQVVDHCRDGSAP